MARELRRTWIIEPVNDPESGLLRADRRGATELLDALEGTLWAFGGKVQIVADRVRTGVVPRQGMEPEFPLAETLGYIVEYDESVSLQDESMTAKIAQQADETLGDRQDAARAPVEPLEPEDLDVDEHSPVPTPVAG